MKAKLVISSVATMALFGALAIGGTYSLFSSQEEANIAVTAGKVEVKAEIADAKLYSGEWNAETASYDDKELTGMTFTNGGTASIDGGTLTLDKLTPMDKIEFKINVENESNVAVKWRTKVLVAEDDGLFSGLDVKINDDYIYGETASEWADLAPEEALTDGSYTVSISLPEYAGNEYAEKKAKIQFAVEAVQGNAVVENADNVWDGTYPSGVTASDQKRPAGFVVDPTTRTITIKDAESLAYLSVYNMNAFDFGGYAGYGEGHDAGYDVNYYYSWDWTVKLDCDIDLAGHEWTPIVAGENGVPAYKEFDGCGHSIANLKVTGAYNNSGFFGQIKSMSNILFGNAEIVHTATSGSAGVAAGSTTDTMKNVIVKHSSVTGAKYVGGVAGYGYSGFVGCKLVASAVTNTGSKDVGGIVGFNNESRTVINNGVYNVTLTNSSSASEKNVGAIVGRWNNPQSTETALNYYGNVTNTAYDLIGAVANGTMPVQPIKH